MGEARPCLPMCRQRKATFKTSRGFKGTLASSHKPLTFSSRSSFNHNSRLCYPDHYHFHTVDDSYTLRQYPPSPVEILAADHGYHHGRGLHQSLPSSDSFPCSEPPLPFLRVPHRIFTPQSPAKTKLDLPFYRLSLGHCLSQSFPSCTDHIRGFGTSRLRGLQRHYGLVSRCFSP